MDGQEVGDLLEECVRAAAGHSVHQEAQTLERCSCRESLGNELTSLLQDAVEMKWPFVPEKWQYKQSISAEDKTNVNDLIGRHLPQLLAFLKASIAAQDVPAALAVVFLVDRFFYWTDESSRLLKVAKLLHRRHPGVPLAPQLLIRQARVYLNSGKLQKAEYILCSLINNNGATGCWPYPCDSDRALVQAVSVQVRGMVLQKLGLWLQAAELIWASLVGYFALPQPDKKGIGTSLGILANILVSMNDEDFQTFQTSAHMDSCFLDAGRRRLLSAAAAARTAVVYSQYTSLYVLTNVVTQGTCLLSYSFSVDCPPEQRPSFRLRAKEAFAIGLLTRRDDERVTSKQELHTLVKAAYSLAVTHKWLGAPSELVTEATGVCQRALGHFYDYCHAAAQDRDVSGSEVMRLIARAKRLLRVEPFANSNEGSFIPDSYRDAGDVSVRSTLEGFSRVMQRFQKYHASLDETANPRCKGGFKGAKDRPDAAGLCITALETTVGTECSTEVCSLDVPGGDGVPQQRAPDPPQILDQCETLDSSDGLGSSWKNFSLSSSSGSSWASCGGFTGSGGVLRDSSASNHSFFPTTEVDDGGGGGGGGGASRSAEDSGSRDSEKFEVIEAAIDEAAGAARSLSQLLLRTSSSGLSDSFGSQSSWEKISVDQSSTTNREPQTPDFTGAGTGCQSTESTGSFVCLEAIDSASHDPNRDQNGSYTEKQTSLTPEGSSQSSSENPWCHRCRQDSGGRSVTPERQYFLSQQDYLSLLAGVCHECLLKRLQSDKKQFKLKRYETAQSALHLKFSKATGLWTARETCVYIGKPMEKEGKQRAAIWVQFLHQEERLSSYVGKDYKTPKELQFHLKDVERQMTAQYYVTEFNKSLYDRDVMAQIFFIPSEALLILTGDEIEACVTVEPYMLGDFVKLTNNKEKKNSGFQATAYGLAFGHFTYLLSGCQEVVVDLQGWVTANGKGLTYLTDPQIHSTKSPQGPGNFAHRGLRYFLEEQHGPECNSVCQLLKLPSIGKHRVLPEK